LRYPTAAVITILGDPNLLHLGPGCFELFSYYPVEHEDKSVTQELNALTSGIYFVKSIEHSIQGGDFITSISGIKIENPANVPSSITNKLYTAVINEGEASKALKSSSSNTGTSDVTVSKQLSDAIMKQFYVVDLNTSEFAGGLLAKELQSVLTTYKTIH